MDTFLSGRPAAATDAEYLSKLLPYVGAPHHSRLMSMHPLSEVRNGCQMESVSMKEVWKRRKLGNFVLQNSTSESYQSHCEAAGPTAAEFSSNDTINRVRRKHTRSSLAPCDKYKWMKVASTSIGWHAETDHGRSLLRHPAHGIAESTVTKTYSNMKAA
ncbi:unnamed protein product [Symbiodinium pilosum]|uniref:Uncharacterized protein n=1 Tax=Symbiodinium pilosum TaxID=2952 RepID=A0A812MDQ3_SYMPI|nr:unnamed protein product [Symbiodinium pilosum]